MDKQTARYFLDHLATGMWIFLILVWSVALLYLVLRKKKSKTSRSTRL